MKMPKAQQRPSGNWRVQITVDGKHIGITGVTEEETITKALSIKAGMLEQETKPKKLTLGDAITEYQAIRENVLSPLLFVAMRLLEKTLLKIS